MRKKIAKSKTTKRPRKSNASFKDPITGVSVKSDFVYGPESPVSKAWGRYGSEYDTTVEYELSSSKFVVTHIGVSKVDALSRSINRFVFEGEFNYSSAGELSGRLDRSSQGTFYPESYPSGNFESINTLSLDSPVRFSSSTEFRSVANDSTPGGSIPIRNIYAYVANSSATTTTSEYLGEILFSPDKSGLSSLGLDGFYGGEWWINPFATNLV